MKHLVLSTALVFVPMAASAQSQLERFEEMAGQMSAMMGQMMANEVDGHGGDGDIIRAAIPEQDWDSDMRAAAGCILEIYVDESSTSDVNKMLDTMEELIPTMAKLTIEQFSENMSADMMLPEGVTNERSFEISQECGMWDLQMKATDDTAFMDAMIAASATIIDAE